eukprot:GHRR01009140.1.p1 GENE.GHRR01009140.1~~GHRR01009140.1.p1  ORF type:complete len:255 (+),score=65.74 GHRR01009140.1:283-1047(+)
MLYRSHYAMQWRSGNQAVRAVLRQLAGSCREKPAATKLLSQRVLTVTARAGSKEMHPSAPGAVWCVGKNYLDHIKELPTVGLSLGQQVPEEPVIFLKSGSSLLAASDHGSPSPIPLPLPIHWSSDIHHEVELAVQLGHNLQPARLAVALDLTARDVQSKLKQKGYPWTLAKSFPAACPIGPWHICDSQLDLGNLVLSLDVNGVVRQHSSTEHMIFTVPVLLEYIKSRFPVQPGDVVLTGTPAGNLSHAWHFRRL